MVKNIIFLVFLTITFSCDNKNQVNIEKLMDQGVDSSLMKFRKKILFDFSADDVFYHKETVEIHAFIFNSSNDTLYYLTTRCFGEQYELRFDTSKFELTPLQVCTTSRPIIETFAPKEKKEFRAHFGYKGIQKK